MPQVTSWDYANRRFYLHFDTVTNGIDFAAAYLEERAYRAASGASIRGRKPMMSGEGFVAKGGGRFTERYVLLLDDARPVPYDTSHTLRMLVEPITDDGLSGADVFDRAPLSSGTEVNIDVGYSQVEVITVSSGSGLDATQSAQLNNLHGRLTTTRATNLDAIPTIATDADTAATNSATMLTRWSDALAATLAQMGRRLGMLGAIARHTPTSITTTVDGQQVDSYTITNNGEKDNTISED